MNLTSNFVLVVKRKCSMTTVSFACCFDQKFRAFKEIRWLTRFHTAVWMFLPSSELLVLVFMLVCFCAEGPSASKYLYMSRQCHEQFAMFMPFHHDPESEQEAA